MKTVIVHCAVPNGIVLSTWDMMDDGYGLRVARRKDTLALHHGDNECDAAFIEAWLAQHKDAGLESVIHIKS